MKKLLSLALSILICISAFATPCLALEPDLYEIEATVINCRYVESTDKYAFCAVGGIYGNDANDPYTFSVSKDKIEIYDELSLHLDNMPIGQTIRVYFNGVVMESYPMQIIAESVTVMPEKKELNPAETYEYLSMFFTDEWIIENGYSIVTECPEDVDDFIPDYDPDEYDFLPQDEYAYVMGTPKEGEDAGKCVTLSDHYLEGFVVGVEVLDNDVEGSSSSYYTLYFLAYSNFGDEMITPVRIDFSENELGFLGLQARELDGGMKLKIYCTYGSYCVSVEGEKYYKVDGEVLTIEKLDGFEENSSEYAEYFWEVNETITDTGCEMPAEDTDDGGEFLLSGDNFDTVDDQSVDPDYDSDEFDVADTPIEDPIAEAPIVEKKSLAGPITIVLSLAVIASAVVGTVFVIKKK